MGITDDSSQPSAIASSASFGSGGSAIIVMGVCSVAIVLCVASIIFGLKRRGRHQNCNSTGDASLTTLSETRMDAPTDFMNNLASWDRCHSIDEILEKRRRAVWTLEMFENHGNDFVYSSMEDDDEKQHQHSTALVS